MLEAGLELDSETTVTSSIQERTIYPLGEKMGSQLTLGTGGETEAGLISIIAVGHRKAPWQESSCRVYYREKQRSINATVQDTSKTPCEILCTILLPGSLAEDSWPL